MRGDGIGHARGVVDAGQAGQHFRRQLAALLDQLLEQRNQRTRDHVEFTLLRVVDRLDHARTGGQHDARLALDQHLDRAIGQFQQLQHAGQRTDLVQVGDLRVVDIRTFLRDEQDLPLTFHRALQRTHGLVATDKQRYDHVRINHHVAQRQHRQSVQRNGKGGVLGHERGVPRVRIWFRPDTAPGLSTRQVEATGGLLKAGGPPKTERPRRNHRSRRRRRWGYRVRQRRRRRSRPVAAGCRDRSDRARPDLRSRRRPPPPC